MFAMLAEQLKIAFKLLMILTVLTGLLYPAIVTVLGQGFFPWRANGSMIEHQGKLMGSELIGQSFSNPHYFWGRPSATPTIPYNALNSTGSNLAASNPAQIKAVKERVQHLQAFHEQQEKRIPMDLVTASASGLDPEITPYSAFYQVSRVAKARNIPENTLENLITQFIDHRTGFLLGEPRVNVLLLNMALDQLYAPKEL